MEELKPGAEIPTPAGIRFYPCESAGLERRLRELWDEIISIQDEIKFIDRNGFFQE